MKNKFLRKNAAGFSFVELIITISIIGILAAIAVVSMSPARKAARLEAAQKELASEITLAKAYALQGKTQVNPSTNSPETPCGYGVHFISDTSYFIYYNFYPDCETANAGDDTSKLHYSNDSSELDEKALPGGVKKSSNTDIYFTVPSARVYNGSGEEFTSLSIGLTLDDVSNTVSVSKSGLVTIDP